MCHLHVCSPLCLVETEALTKEKIMAELASTKVRLPKLMPGTTDTCPNCSILLASKTPCVRMFFVDAFIHLASLCAPLSTRCDVDIGKHLELSQISFFFNDYLVILKVFHPAYAQIERQHEQNSESSHQIINWNMISALGFAT